MGLSLVINGKKHDAEITRALETVIAKARENWREPGNNKCSQVYIVNTIDDMCAYFPSLPDGEKEIPFGVERNSVIFCFYDDSRRSYNMGVVRNNIHKLPVVRKNLEAALAHDIAHLYNNDVDSMAETEKLLDEVSTCGPESSYLLFVLNNSLCELVAERAAISLGYEKGLWEIRKHEHVLANENPNPKELMEEGITVYGFLRLFEKKAKDETIRTEAKQIREYLHSKFGKTFPADASHIDSICSFIDNVVEKEAYARPEGLRDCGRIDLKNFNYLTYFKL